MDSYENSRIWKETLGKEDYDDSLTQRFVRDLASDFRKFRRQVDQVAKHMPQDLRELTVHDITHIDALWKVASDLCPPGFISNPVEAFVLGGAFLLHDLGLALASYQNGIEDLKKSGEWKISAARLPKDADDASLQAAIDQTLRLRHAKQASSLGTMPFLSPGADPQFLIESTLLRNHLGEIIGIIAESHWNYPDQVETSEQLRILNAIPDADCPSSWTIDSRKIAYVLRVADACQIDSRRAPALTRLLRKPIGVSAEHWDAQQYMLQPAVANGAIVFSSGKAFTADKRSGWWTAFDLARLADKELRAAEDYFEANGRRLMANRVKDVSSAEKFAKHVPVAGWHPVDTAPRISSPASLIQKMGGAQLYGNDFTVPIRELIQNAHDAVVARRILEDRDEHWGKITLKQWNEGKCDFLSIEDCGVGMSSQKILEYLLDFGGSYWKSSLAAQEYPKLFAKGFSPQGMYGIGFYSVFMIADSVKVVTRRPEDAQSATHVLEITRQMNQRPILRAASADETLPDGGTRLVLSLRPELKAKLLRPPRIERGRPAGNVNLKSSWNLGELVEWVCPASEVDLVVEYDSEDHHVVTANDWQSMSAEDLFRRILIHRSNVDELLETPYVRFCISSTQPIIRSDGRMIGRGCLTDLLTYNFHGCGDLDVVTCGAFRSTSVGIGEGIFIGEPSSVTRFTADALCRVSIDRGFTEWATEQANYCANSPLFSLHSKCSIASRVISVCGDPGPLPIALHCREIKSLSKLMRDVAELDEVRLIQRDDVPLKRIRAGAEGTDSKEFVGVLLGTMYGGKFVAIKEDPLRRASHPYWQQFWYAPWGATIEAIAKAWNCELQKLLENSELRKIDTWKTLPPGAILRRPK